MRTRDPLDERASGVAPSQAYDRGLRQRLAWAGEDSSTCVARGRRGGLSVSRDPRARKGPMPPKRGASVGPARHGRVVGGSAGPRTCRRRRACRRGALTRVGRRAARLPSLLPSPARINAQLFSVAQTVCDDVPPVRQRAVRGRGLREGGRDVDWRRRAACSGSARYGPVPMGELWFPRQKAKLWTLAARAPPLPRRLRLRPPPARSVSAQPSSPSLLTPSSSTTTSSNGAYLALPPRRQGLVLTCRTPALQPTRFSNTRKHRGHVSACVPSPSLPARPRPGSSQQLPAGPLAGPALSSREAQGRARAASHALDHCADAFSSSLCCRARRVLAGSCRAAVTVVSASTASTQEDVVLPVDSTTTAPTSTSTTLGTSSLHHPQALGAGVGRALLARSWRGEARGSLGRARRLQG